MAKVRKLPKLTFFSNIFKSKGLRLFFMFFTLWVVLFFSLITTNSTGKYDYRVGDTARENIILQQDVIDDLATTRLKDRAEREVEPVLTIDPMVQVSVRKKNREFFEALTSYRSDFAENEDVLKQIVVGAYRNDEMGLTNDQLSYLAVMDQRRLEELETISEDVIAQILSSGLAASDLDQTKTDMQVFFNQVEGFSDEEKQIGSALVNGSLRPNQFVDEEATKRVIVEQRSRIDNVVISAGTVLLREGAYVTAENLRVLQLADLLYQQDMTDTIASFGALGISTALVVGIIVFMRSFHPNTMDDMKKMMLVIVTFIGVYLASKAFAVLSIYLIPAALFTILVTVAVGPSIGMVMSVLLNTAIILWTDGPVDAYLAMVVSSGVAALAVRHVNQRSNILLAGVWVGVTQGALILLLGARAMLDLQVIIQNGAFAMLGGFLSGILAIGLLPICEAIFHVLTPMRLLELSNPNHPLMKRLLMEAPGTYHHSILVGNLAEAATHAVDGNGLLARVGSFYHDIGKLERPYYFKENQISGENPHDRLIPGVSASIIKRHSEHGLELGVAHKLPAEILDIIGQHHGTTRIQYFYHKALEKADDPSTIDLNQFAYDGPVPQSIEAAIVMLADSVEAAVRSIPEPTQSAVQDMVEKIVHQKLADGQLRNCDLHFRDLDIVINSFMRVLRGIFHERIEYPELPADSDLSAEVEE